MTPLTTSVRPTVSLYLFGLECVGREQVDFAVARAGEQVAALEPVEGGDAQTVLGLLGADGLELAARVADGQDVARARAAEEEVLGLAAGHRLDDALRLAEVDVGGADFAVGQVQLPDAQRVAENEDEWG